MTATRVNRAEAMRIGAPIAILLFGLAGFFVLKGLKKDPPRKEDNEDHTATVETVTAVPHSIGFDIQATGLVVPFREITVPAEVAGRIFSKKDYCRAGRYIAEGKELLQIDKKDYEFVRDESLGAIEELRSEVTSTESLLKIANRQLEIEKRDYERETKLRGVVSSADLDQAERELLAAQNSVATLQSQLSNHKAREKRLDAAFRRAKLNLDRTTISSPVSGVIVEDMVEEDAFVQAGTTLVTIEDTSKAEITCNLRKEDLQWLWLSQSERSPQKIDQVVRDYEIPKAEVEVHYDLLGVLHKWDGRLDRFDGIGLDSKTRTIPCRIVVDEPRDVSLVEKSANTAPSSPPALLRGMYVTVQIKTNPMLPLWRISKDSLRPGKFIWIVRDGKLSKRNVRIAQSLKDDIIVHIENGQFSEDDRIVISPLAYPHEGLEVREVGQK